ncbi:MAG: hypothetical protein GXP29_14515, partial [Planctomycetes bacterium]|nr:hypothetical protein [Planctomycetota bacterium]
RVVRIRGLIDRVDLAELADETVGIVVDYKRTRNKRFDVGEAYHGLSLQLLGYLLLLADQGETLAGRPIRPVGAFYVSLLQGYESVDHPADAADLAPDRGAAPRGILDTDRIDVLESEAPPTGRSKIFSFFRKKDGTLGNIDRGDGAEQEQFADLLEHTRYKLGELADRILDGDVGVAPYRLKDFSPCQWCEVNSVCRFEFGDRGMRHLVPMKRSEVFTQLGGDE